MRAKQTRTVSGSTTTTYYVDKYYEADSDGSWRAYLDDIAVLSYTPQRSHLLQYTLRDRLGSATTMADQSGNVVSRRYFDPFGKTTSQSPSASLLENIRGMVWDLNLAKLLDLDATNKNRRGFTDHEHLNEQQLIHMNGRVYDYNLGRFMSVDPLIQSPTSTQSINPYSYIMNNPLAGTDPTGYKAQCSDDNNCDIGSIDIKDVESIQITKDGNMVVNTNNGSFQVNSIGGKDVQGAFSVSDVGSMGANAKVMSATGGSKTVAEENPIDKINSFVKNQNLKYGTTYNADKDHRDETSIDVKIFYIDKTPSRSVAPSVKDDIETGIKNEWTRDLKEKGSLTITTMRVASEKESNLTITLHEGPVGFVSHAEHPESQKDGHVAKNMTIQFQKGDALGKVAAHEFGHILGFYNRYSSVTQQAYPGYQKDIMGSVGSNASVRDRDRDIKTVIDNY